MLCGINIIPHNIQHIPFECEDTNIAQSETSNDTLKEDTNVPMSHTPCIQLPNAQKWLQNYTNYGLLSYGMHLGLWTPKQIKS
jgi:hypothetical protein